MPHPIALSLSFLLFLAIPTAAQTFSPSQNEVWQMEETYWKDLHTANYSHYMTLWHEDFLGWPYFTAHPVNKDGIADSLPTKMSAVSFYEFLEKDVRVTAEVAITQYAVKYTVPTPTGESETRVSRITHTWLKTKNTWQIIGGMSLLVSSSSQPSSPAPAPSSSPDVPASPPASHPK